MLWKKVFNTAWKGDRIREEYMAAQKRKPKKRTVKPGKNIVASMADDFRKRLLKMVNQGIKDLTLDLTGVDMVDSVGLGIFIAAHNSMEDVGGKFKIINVTKDIYDLVHMMRLDRHFEVSMGSK
jgi:anti-sigma B factor antagonist